MFKKSKVRLFIMLPEYCSINKDEVQKSIMKKLNDLRVNVCETKIVDINDEITSLQLDAFELNENKSKTKRLEKRKVSINLTEKKDEVSTHIIEEELNLIGKIVKFAPNIDNNKLDINDMKILGSNINNIFKMDSLPTTMILTNLP